MSIRVTCPNGHHLKVKDSLAGRVGLCPMCHAKVRVPELSKVVSEDDILGFLGPHDPSQDSHLGSASDSGLGGSKIGLGERTSPPKKSCSNCNREIAAGTHICPFCRMYIANLRDL